MLGAFEGQAITVVRPFIEKRLCMKYSIVLPGGWKMSLANIKDTVETYETMTNVAKAADRYQFLEEEIWLTEMTGIAS